MLPEICDALDRVNIVEPFPIQEMTLPVALMGTDLIGQARTGTGKTLGFGIPLLQRTISPGEPDYEELAAPGKPQALVVTPTRELTIQVAKDLTTASTVRTVRILTIYGGVAYEPQLEMLKSGVDVVVGTPGRLLDLANRGVLDLSHIKVLVLDEADEMLDLGFLPDVERILRKTPELRQTMLFSATMPSAVIGLARTHMRHPLNIRAESHEDTQMVPTTAQFVYRAHDLDKPEVVARILQAEDRGRVMIFCRTKREAGRLTDDLADRGFKAAAIHGDLNQQARERALTRFRGDKIDVLICTDVAARGIDVEGVTHVINNTCPEDEKAYIHRIGRTGRAGASGIAVTFVDWADVTRWKTINKALDLPYDEPQEIYSTSPELYHDLGIPTSAKGRIKAAREDKPERDRPPRRSEAEAGSSPASESSERPGRKRNRNRRRTRSGRPLDGVVGNEPKSESDVTAKTQVPPTEESSSQAGEGVRERKPRQRNRRRRTSESAESSTSTEQVTAEPAAATDVTASTDVTAAATGAETGAPVQAEAAVEQKAARRTRTRRAAAKGTDAQTADDAQAADIAGIGQEPGADVATAASVEASGAAEANAAAEQKPARRTRTRKTAAKAAEADNADAAGAAEPAAEVATDTEAATAAEAKPARRTRTRKAAAAAEPIAAEAAAEPVAAPTAAEPVAAETAADVPAEKPVKRARTRKAAAAEPVAEDSAASAAEAPAKKTAAKRTRKATATPVADETAPGVEAAGDDAAAEKPAKRAARKTAAKKTAAKKATAKPTAAADEITDEAKPAKRTRTRKAAPTTPTFTAPE
ncbi:DEAD/DEAH box helicase domain protein [Kribbella flavida DSM 17836]|uniref:RNA helicase n=2 Tax=Kribbella flavida TaxID=182640 RepID=D2PLC1_KRIFD|nr:DEAD/DEAH box helicase domain protein [Kribbella flavida DSM 17836]